MTLTLRSAKGSALTHAELDGNFTDPIATNAAVSAAQAQAGYAITRTGPDILVELTEDLNAAGTFALPSSPASGDIVRVVRHGGGTGLWSRTGGDSSDVLRGRDDLIEYQRSGSAWIRVLQREQQVLRVNAATYTVSGGDHLLDLVFHTTACTVTLPNNLGTRTRFRLVQEGSAIVSVTLASGALSAPATSPPLATTGDGTALAVTVIGNSTGTAARYRLVLEAPQAGGIGLDGNAAVIHDYLYRDWAETVIVPTITAGTGGGGVTVAASDQAEGSGTAISVVLPAHVANDVVVILLSWATQTFNLSAAPSGWTYSPASPIGSFHKGVVVRRRMAGAAEANPAFTLSGVDPWMYKVAVLRGVHATTMDDAAAQSSTGASTLTSASAPSVTTVTANAMVLCACTVNSPDTMPATPEMTVPSGFTKVETAEEHLSGGMAIALAYKTQAAAGSSGGPHVFGWGGSQEEANVWTYAFRPAGTAATVALDYALGHYQRLTLSTANLGSGINTLIVTGISNPPPNGQHGAITLKVVQDASVGGRSLDLSALNPRYQDGSAPGFSATAGGIDKLLLETDDGGATWEISNAMHYQA